jgi:pimeloyl-ACP methyl ester carboxylesterase
MPLQDTGASGADPRPYLERLRIPALWLYGTADGVVPFDQSVALLNTFEEQGKDFTVATFPDGVMACSTPPPTDPQATTTLVEWVLKRVLAEVEKRS